MQTKLTLTIEEKVIRKAKGYANGKKRSLSELVENFFKSLASDVPSEGPELSSNIKSLMGSFKAPKDFDYKKVLREEKIRRHG